MASNITGTRARIAITASAYGALAGVALVFLMIAAFSLPVFFSGLNAGGVFSWEWRPSAGRFGIAPMIAGTLFIALSAAATAWPLALGFSSLALTTRSRPVKILADGLIRLMASIPTVVYGFASIFLLAPLVRKAMGGGSGFGLLTTIPVLALLVFPTMAVVMRAALRERMKQAWPEAAALGLTRVQTMAHVVIPSARRGLAAAAGLGVARAIGDTMISLMLSGNAPHLPAHPADGFRTLTAHMALVTSNEVGGAAYDSLFAAGAIVLLASCGIGAIVRRLAAAKTEGAR